jgi:hypothetical protein
MSIELFYRGVWWGFGFPVDFVDQFFWLFVFLDVLVDASGEYLTCGKAGDKSLLGVCFEGVDVEFEVEVFAAFFGGDCGRAVNHEDAEAQTHKEVLIPGGDIGLGRAHPGDALDWEWHFNISQHFELH